jgi:hypothetical protein
MDKENNIVYVKAKNGIYKCYKSEQMHKPIYYPIESKTNGYIDYYDVIDILSADDLYNELKKQKEVIDKAIETLEKGITFCENDSQGIYDKCNIAINREKKVLEILKEVSE